MRRTVRRARKSRKVQKSRRRLAGGMSRANRVRLLQKAPELTVKNANRKVNMTRANRVKKMQNNAAAMVRETRVNVVQNAVELPINKVRNF